MNRKIKYVSFDVYDTLVKRIIPEKQMYYLIERNLEKKEISCSIGFAEKRITAEKNLQKSKVKNYTIWDIYNNEIFHDLSNEEKNFLIQEEEKAEINNCVISWSGFELYSQMRKSYPIICISDMYWGEETIKKILNANGYYPEKIYVSSERNHSKRCFDLYSYVFADLNIEAQELLHIGDAKRSDYVNPKFLGMHSTLFKNHELKGKHYYKYFGSEFLGPLVYEFCNWIHSIAGNGNLLFLAREGDVFARYYNQMFHTNCKTVYVSRKAILKGVFYDFLKNSRLEELADIISLNAFETVGDFSMRVGIDLDTHEAEMNQCNIKAEDRLTVQFFKYLEENQSQYLSELYENKVLFDQYINTFIDATKTNYLVDLGWKGSMQKCLEMYCKINNQTVNIQGLYFGCMDTENKSGFAFQNTGNVCQDFLCFSGLLEIVFMPKYGSVLGYISEGGEVVPVFEQLEFPENVYQIIESVQDGVETVIKNMTRYAGSSCFDKEKYIKKLIDFGCKPTKNDIEQLKPLVMYDNGKTMELVPSYSFQERFNIKKLVHDFINSKWKTAFCIDVFKVRLPYNHAINFLRRGGKNKDMFHSCSL